ncbi:DUF1735 domain-containing protein [Paraflavitalea sp. CAU 1676]|uniref:DUF1735 domain-containing protein n=1 Tax=Paraflavitalea sp. CAU 1676 TaxID=3032598 RepID=UPI0023DC5D52|nr:DUF1735 domain-containing protein [Paraflavitalea sp. CAU 1676]MDF2193354.1 DUF1735 domain-containing protein [Paraflavitalea sp. CAU 1676]
MMKKIYYTLAALSILSTGCLKDKGYEDHQTGMKSVTSERFVSILYPYETAGLHTNDIFTKPAEEPVETFTVALTGPVYNKDVQLTLTAVPALVSEHNDANDDVYEVLPAANYELPASITIPAGHEYAVVHVKIKKTGLDPVGAYGLGVQIATVSDASVKIASNARQSLMGILFRNDYDGVYQWRSVTVHPNTAAYNGRITPIEVGLVTTGGSSVETDRTHPWANGVSQPDNYNVTFSVDPSTNKVTVSNARGNAFADSPGYDSRYDPATKTIYAKWQYSGGGGNRVMTDTLVFLRARD